MRWECLHASFCEETEFEAFEHGTYPASDSIPSLFCNSELHPPEEEYKQLFFFHCLREFYVNLIARYSRRQLTYDSDALNAIQGILRTVTDHTGLELFWGLTCILFERNLLWEVTLRSRRRDHEGFPSWSWLNYRDIEPEALKDDVRCRALIRCYRRVSDSSSPGADKKTFLLQPVSDRTRCPSYMAALDIFPAAEYLEVKEADVSPNIQERIRPNYHIIFWGYTIRVRWRQTYKDDGDLFLHGSEAAVRNLSVGAQRRAAARKRDLWDKTLSSGRDSDIEALMADDSDGGSNGMETGDPNAIGSAFSEPRYRDNRKNMECEVVKVLGTSGVTETVVSVRGLLILEKDDGIAEKVGNACLSLKRIRSLPWKRRLVVLG